MTQWSQNLFEKATFELLFSPLQFHKQSSELKNNLWNRYRCMEIQMQLYNEFRPIVYHMRLYYDLYSNIWIFHRNFVFESMTCLNRYAYISLIYCKSHANQFPVKCISCVLLISNVFSEKQIFFGIFKFNDKFETFPNLVLCS